MENKKHNVLIWSWGRRGGAPNFAWYIANELKNSPIINVSVSISEYADNYADFINKTSYSKFIVKTYYNKLTALLSLFRINRIKKQFEIYLRNEKIDVVVCPFTHLWNPFFVKLFKKLNCQFITFVHDATPHPGEDYFGRQRWLNKEINAADQVFCLSEHVRSAVIKNLKIDRAKTHVVKHGIFKDLGCYVQRGDFFTSSRAIRLLFFGRFLAYKGIDLLLAAFERIQAQIPNVELHMVGSGELTRQQSKIIEQNSKISLINRWIDEAEIANFFHDKDLVLLPYIEASQSGVVSVAAANALPVVVTPVGGLAEQITHEKNGLIASAVDVDAFSSEVVRILKSEKLYRQCSNGMIEAANEEFSWKNVAEKIEQVICVE